MFCVMSMLAFYCVCGMNVFSNACDICVMQELGC